MKKLLITSLTTLLILTSAIACSSSNQEKTGAYTSTKKVTTSQQQLFDKVMKNDAKNYKLINVATQVVAGTNYKFYAQDLTSKKESFVYLTIFVPLDKKEEPKLIEKTKA